MKTRQTNFLTTSIVVFLIGMSYPIQAQPVQGQEIQATEIGRLKSSGKLIIDDNFDRNVVGKNWVSNDDRAQRTSHAPQADFKPQLQIKDNALKVIRTAGSDHAATARTDAKFKDGIFELRFRLTDKDKFNLNTSDPNCDTVHAGHIWSVQIAPTFVMIQDQKTGSMDLKIRELRTSGKDKERVDSLLKNKSLKVNTDIAPGKWHDLQVIQRDRTIVVKIDGEQVAQFSSAGIGHETKERVAFSVPASVEIDDVKIWRVE